jgi:hypothetical protein
MGKARRRKKQTDPHGTRQRAEPAHAGTDPTPAPRDGRAATHAPTTASVYSGKGLWVSLALIAANLVIYAPVRQYAFVNTDDGVYVTANATVLQGLSWSNVRWALTDARVPYWHPLTYLSHMLDVQLYGVNAGGHHVTSVILHIASTVLLFGLLLEMTGGFWKSAVAAGLFALHPLRVESVAWIAERKDVLSTFFWIATTWAYVRWVRRPAPKRYALVVVLFGLGLMAKPMIVTLPFALLLLDYWPLGRTALPTRGSRGQRVGLGALVKEKIPLFVLAAFASLATLGAQQDVGAVNSLEAISLRLRVANAVQSYVAYLGDSFWPARLAALYPYPTAVAVGPLLIALLVLGAVTALVVVMRRQRPYLLVGWLWYLGTLLPVIGLIQVGPQARADRFTYVPAIGLVLMVVWGVADVAQRFSKRQLILTPLAVAALVACTLVSIRQVRPWRDSIALWEHTLAVTRDNGVAHYNYGMALTTAGRGDDAIRQLREAVRLEPDFAFAHERLGLALGRRGDHAGAAVELKEVVRIMPENAGAHSNLGLAFANQGKTAEAIAEFSQAVLLDPQDSNARARLELLKRGGALRTTPAP